MFASIKKYLFGYPNDILGRSTDPSIYTFISPPLNFTTTERYNWYLQIFKNIKQAGNIREIRYESYNNDCISLMAAFKESDLIWYKIRPAYTSLNNTHLVKIYLIRI